MLQLETGNNLLQNWSGGSIWSALAVLCIGSLLTWALNIIWVRPLTQKRFLQRHGFSVMPYTPLVGNIPHIMTLYFRSTSSIAPSPFDHDLASRLFPFSKQMSLKYGKSYVYWWGTEPRLLVTDPEVIKQILSSKFRQFKKSPDSYLILDKMFGMGLISAEGEEWEKQRHILNPAFYADKIKVMSVDMVASTKNMLDSWKEMVKEGRGSSEIEVSAQLKNLTADVIARTCFGSSYQKGKKIFVDQVVLLDLIFNNFSKILLIPGYRFFPTSLNRHCWALEKTIEKELRKIVESRRDSVKKGGATSYGTDMLGLILTYNEDTHHLQQLPSSNGFEGDDKKRKKNLKLSTREVMDEVKTFFFAGHETTASLLTWALFFLSIYPEWQDRLRNEVMEICGSNEEIKIEHLSKLKLMGMVMSEVLRFYPPVPQLIARTPTTKGHSLKVTEDLEVPAGTSFAIISIMLHRDKEYWGQDADEFNPMRFVEGVLRACTHPYAYVPFGGGPHICIGQQFALMEAKLVAASILHNFPSFKLSPNYKHDPQTRITTYPGHGLQLIFSNSPNKQSTDF